MTADAHLTPREMKERLELFRGTSVYKKNKSLPKGVSVIITVVSDLFSGLLVGAGIGYLLYRFCGVHSLIFALFVLLGGLAGILNIFKSIRHLEKDKQNENA